MVTTYGHGDTGYGHGNMGIDTDSIPDPFAEVRERLGVAQSSLMVHLLVPGCMPLSADEAFGHQKGEKRQGYVDYTDSKLNGDGKVPETAIVCTFTSTTDARAMDCAWILHGEMKIPTRVPWDTLEAAREIVSGEILLILSHVRVRGNEFSDDMRERINWRWPMLTQEKKDEWQADFRDLGISIP